MARAPNGPPSEFREPLRCSADVPPKANLAREEAITLTVTRMFFSSGRSSHRPLRPACPAPHPPETDTGPSGADDAAHPAAPAARQPADARAWVPTDAGDTAASPCTATRGQTGPLARPWAALPPLWARESSPSCIRRGAPPRPPRRCTPRGPLVLYASVSSSPERRCPRLRYR
eukprot:scaffold3319_cov258-Pinguiococcus_pyrenoidosus.AAC.14